MPIVSAFGVRMFQSTVTLQSTIIPPQNMPALFACEALFAWAALFGW